jgi:hypothetical protein
MSKQHGGHTCVDCCWQDLNLAKGTRYTIYRYFESLLKSLLSDNQWESRDMVGLAVLLDFWIKGGWKPFNVVINMSIMLQQLKYALMIPGYPFHS